MKIYYDESDRGTTPSRSKSHLSRPARHIGADACLHIQEDFACFQHDFDAEGVQVHVHAIGDGAVRGTLDAYEEAWRTMGSVTHATRSPVRRANTDEDIQRMADLNVVGALQFLWMYGDALCDLERAYIGDERALAMYPVKKMRDAGIAITGASDAPVTPFVVLDEIEVGITRNSPYPEEEDTDMTRWPEQALSLPDALMPEHQETLPKLHDDTHWYR